MKWKKITAVVIAAVLGLSAITENTLSAVYAKEPKQKEQETELEETEIEEIQSEGIKPGKADLEKTEEENIDYLSGKEEAALQMQQENVPINQHTFPDEIFRQYVIDNISKGDFILTEEEIKETVNMDLSSSQIVQLKGIEYFKYLTELNCADNNLESLDVSKNLWLTSLDCQNNCLSNLDVSENPQLAELYCEDNNLVCLTLGEKYFEEDLLSIFPQKECSIDIQNEETYDLKNIAPSMEESKISNVTGAVIDNTVLKDMKAGSTVSYDYDCGSGQILTAALKLEQSKEARIKENRWIIPLIIDDWTYGGYNSGPEAEAEYGEVYFLYSSQENGIYTEKVPKEAGIYYVKAMVDEIDGYAKLESDPVKFTIKPAKAYIITWTSSITAQYSKNKYYLNAKASNDEKLLYDSKNKKVATVDQNGIITLKGVGKTILTIKLQASRNYTADFLEIPITVSKGFRNIKADPILKMKGDKPFYLKVTAEGKAKFSFKSYNKNVVTVNSKGKVTIKGSGDAQIMVTAAGDSTYQKTEKIISVTVTPGYCRILKEGKTGRYDLDGKGKKETIKVSVKKRGYKNESGYVYNYDFTTTVTVNGKKVYKKTFKMCHENPVKIMVIDADKKDRQMELMIIEGVGDMAWVSDMSHIYYYQYKNGKTIKKQDITALFKKGFSKKNVYRLHAMQDSCYLTMDGKGKVYATICLNVENFGYVHVKTTVVLKNGKFAFVPSKEYEVLDAEFFRSKKNITVYAKPNGKKKVYTIKKGQVIYFCKLYCSKNGKIYLKVKNQNGKTGYIDPQKVPTYVDGTLHA